MKYLRHGVAALVLLSVIIGLYVNMYSGIEQGYDITVGDLQYSNQTGQTDSIINQLNNLSLMEGISELQAGVNDLKAPTNPLDVLGGLASVGTGFIKTTVGLITIPFTVTYIILDYYAGSIPASIVTGLLMMIVVYVAFILISVYVRDKV